MTPSALGQRLQRHEPWFIQFLVATLLPILVMPFTNLEGNTLQRLLLPLSTLWLAVIAMRIMPVDVLRLGLCIFHAHRAGDEALLQRGVHFALLY